MDYRTVLGALAVLVGIVGYIPYFRDIFKRKTKPHFFSWFIWSLLGGIDFVAQIMKDGGSGSWATCLTATICFTIAILSLSHGEKEITKTDLLSFIAALIGVILWLFTRSALSAVIIITVTDALAFIPTFRKTYYKPYEETSVQYIFAASKWALGLGALRSFTLTTALYPASIILTDGLFVTLLVWRRKIAAKH